MRQKDSFFAEQFSDRPSVEVSSTEAVRRSRETKNARLGFVHSSAPRMARNTFIAAALTLASFAAAANNCDAIRSQIEAKVRASGVSAFTLTTVDAGAQAPGRVVGTCDLGTKKIVYEQAHPRSAAGPSRPLTTVRPAPDTRNEPILTECKDGSVSLGGGCK